MKGEKIHKMPKILDVYSFVQSANSVGVHRYLGQRDSFNQMNHALGYSLTLLRDSFNQMNHALGYSLTLLRDSFNQMNHALGYSLTLLRGSFNLMNPTDKDHGLSLRSEYNMTIILWPLTNQDQESSCEV